LNENPDNYFAHVEQAAFAPAHVVDGIGYSPDKMLQGRILSYPDAHRYRLGGNYEQIPVNRCPFMVNNYQRDGQMTVNGNHGSGPNYSPNSFDDIEADASYKEPALNVNNQVADWYDRNAEGENDHYTQPGNLYRLMSQEAKADLIKNIVHSMKGIDGPKKELITNRQLCHWFRADMGLGMAIAKGLDLNLQETMAHMPG
jgi:catalase